MKLHPHQSRQRAGSSLRLLYAFPEPLPLPRARGLQVAHALTSLDATGAEVLLAYVPVAGLSPFTPLGRDHVDSIKTLPLPRSWPAPLDRIPPFRAWHSTRFFALRLWREIDRKKPDLLYIRHLKLAALAAARSDLPPLVYEAHEVFADTASPRKKAKMAELERRVMAGSSGIVCNSRATAVRLQERYGPARRLLVLPNGVAPMPEPPEKPWADSRRHIVYAGSFFGWKGVDDLILAAKHLPGYKFTLIGGDDQHIERLRAMLGSDGAEVNLLPRLPQSEVAQHLAAACIAVLPNRPEPDSAFTSPIKLFEYMAAGCALVVSDLPALHEILEEEDAAWFTPGDSSGLAAALRRLAEAPDDARAMGQHLRVKSAAYTWPARAAQLKEFLETLLAEECA